MKNNFLSYKHFTVEKEEDRSSSQWLKCIIYLLQKMSIGIYSALVIEALILEKVW